MLCGRQGADTADHVRPRYYGGGNELGNLAPAHLHCNSGRKAKPLTEQQWQRVEAYRLILSVH